MSDGRVFDWIEPVHARYAATPRRRATLDIWSANRKRATIARDQTLRIIGGEPFVVTWTTTDWRERRQSSSTGTLLGVWYVDIVTAPDAARLRFTTANDAHEYSVDVTD